MAAKMRLSALWFLAVSLVAAPQADRNETADVSKARVEGVVIDESGNLVAGVEVNSIGSGKGGAGRATAAADGAFRLVLNAPSSRYHTFIASPGPKVRRLG